MLNLTFTLSWTYGLINSKLNVAFDTSVFVTTELNGGN